MNVPTLYKILYPDGETEAMNIDTAENEINGILRELEIDTGSVVESISMNDIDITSLGDDRQVLGRSVKVVLRPLPGSKWFINGQTSGQ